MDQTFLFYDLETSGLSPQTDRIMQFAAQRTDLELNPIGGPVNLFVRLDNDILPNPHAILVTGTTPQKTHQQGIPEKDLLQLIHTKLFTPGTIAVGFNNIKFDDEFIRYANWRNFYDPYEWTWKDNRSRWDMLNVIRFTRALRPEGITWPTDANGQPINKLEKLTLANNLHHDHAHDGLSDVVATIQVAKLIRDHHPKLFTYLFNNRGKNDTALIASLSQPQPFVYTASRYGPDHHYTSVAIVVSEGSRPQEVITYDLRHDPTPWLNRSAADIATARFTKTDQLLAQGLTPFPFTRLTYNQCPAVAPVSVLDGNNGWAKLDLTPDLIQKHLNLLRQNPQLIDEAAQAYQADRQFAQNPDPETRLYNGFVSDADKRTLANLRTATPQRLATWNPIFHDERLPQLLIHYKARNYPDMLTPDEQRYWQEYRTLKLATTSPKFLAALDTAKQTAVALQQPLLQALQSWHDQLTNPTSESEITLPFPSTDLSPLLPPDQPIID